jgi:hypothetical protein
VVLLHEETFDIRGEIDLMATPLFMMNAENIPVSSWLVDVVADNALELNDAKTLIAESVYSIDLQSVATTMMTHGDGEADVKFIGDWDADFVQRSLITVNGIHHMSDGHDGTLVVHDAMRTVTRLGDLCASAIVFPENVRVKQARLSGADISLIDGRRRAVIKVPEVMKEDYLGIVFLGRLFLGDSRVLQRVSDDLISINVAGLNVHDMLVNLSDRMVISEHTQVPDHYNNPSLVWKEAILTDEGITKLFTTTSTFVVSINADAVAMRTRKLETTGCRGLFVAHLNDAEMSVNRQAVVVDDYGFVAPYLIDDKSAKRDNEVAIYLPVKDMFVSNPLSHNTAMKQRINRTRGVDPNYYLREIKVTVRV